VTETPAAGGKGVWDRIKIKCGPGCVQTLTKKRFSISARIVCKESQLTMRFRYVM